MNPIRVPAYTRLLYDLVDPEGGPPRQGAVIISPADLWPHWPEAYDLRWSALEIGPLVVALKVDGLAPSR